MQLLLLCIFVSRNCSIALRGYKTNTSIAVIVVCFLSLSPAYACTLQDLTPLCALLRRCSLTQRFSCQGGPRSKNIRSQISVWTPILGLKDVASSRKNTCNIHSYVTERVAKYVGRKSCDIPTCSIRHVLHGYVARRYRSIGSARICDSLTCRNENICVG